MLYAEHTLRQFNILGRETIVLKMLDHYMPESLEKLHDTMLKDLQEQTGADQLQALKCLLWWLAFSYRPLTVDECLSVLQHSTDGSLNLDQELQGRQLSRFIRIADFEERLEFAPAQNSILEIQSQNNSDAAYNDGDLPLKFQERSIRGFFRGAEKGETGLRTPASEAHRHIFIFCSKVLCSHSDEIHDSLRKYAAEHWAWHLSWTRMLEDSEPDRIAGLDALGAIMTNETGAAKVIETLGVDYDEINEEFKNELLLKNMAWFAKMVDSLDGKVTPTTSAWAKAVVADRLAAFVPLARGHISNWFQSRELKSALRSYRFARAALKMVSL